jgi:HEAT repeat protein
MGKVALPCLELASNDADLEVAGRARAICHWIRIDSVISAKVRKYSAGIVDQLAAGDDPTWTRTLLGVIKQCKKLGSLDESLTSEDLAPFFPKALRGARKSFEVRQVCGIVETFGLREYVADIADLLQSKSADVRLEAVEVLGGFREPGTFAALRECLQDPDVSVRGATVALLGRMGDQISIPVIRELLSDPDQGIRWKSAIALGMAKAKEASPDIRNLLRDPSDDAGYVRMFALLALDLLDDSDAGDDILPLLGDEYTCVRMMAADVAGNLRLKQAIPMLRMMLLRDTSGAVREHAATSLGILGAQESTVDLLAVLVSPDQDFSGGDFSGGTEQVHVGVAGALARLNRKEARADLSKLLESSNIFSQSAAAEALCDLGFPDGVPIMLKLKISLEWLNALKSPLLWKSLDQRREFRFRFDVEVGKDVLDELARALDLTVVWPPDMKLLSARRYSHECERQSIREVIHDVLGAEYSFVLETGKIRVLLEAEAFALWSEWWKQER